MTVRLGEFVVLQGPSGSGKSTLLNVAGALVRPDVGQVLFQGHDIATLTQDQRSLLRRRSVGFVLQSYNLFPALSAFDNVALPLRLDKRKAADVARDVRRALERVGMAERAGERADRLSGGEQQRVAIARAMTAKQSLILADEPTGALDRATGALVIALLRKFCQNGGSVLVATHDPSVAAAADRRVTISDGVVSVG